MNIRTGEWAIMGVILGVALVALASAAHYRGTAASLREAYREARIELDALEEELEVLHRVAPARDRAARSGRPVSVSADWESPESAGEVEVAPRPDERVEAAQPLSTPEGTEDTEPQDRRRWLERLAETDPERYAEIQERREAARHRVRESFAQKTAHFLYRDRDTLTDDERREYDYMLSLLGETWMLVEQLQDGDVPDRREARRELRQNMRTLRPMLERERDREFFDMAVQLGYDEQGANEFVDYVNEMIDITSFGSLWGGTRSRQ